MKYIWRQINVGFAKETTRWTAVAPTFWYPKTNIDFDEKIETVIDESSLWVKVKGTDIEVIKRYGEWTVEWYARVNSIGLLFLNLLGKDTVTELQANEAYEHKFEIDNNAMAPSLTVSTAEPNGDYMYPLAMLKSFTISAKVWEFISISAEFKSKKWESATLTATYPDNDYKFSARHSIFKMATDLAGLPWASEACIETFELTISRTTEEEYCLNSWVDVWDLIDWTIEITWSIVATYNDEATYKVPALNWETRAMELKLVDTNIDLGGWNNPTIDITMPKVAFTDYGRDKWNDNTVKQNLWFTALQDTTSWKAIEIKVINSVDQY